MSEQQAPREPSRLPDWPICEADRECYGVQLDVQLVCLAHADQEGRKNYLAALQPGAMVDLRGTVSVIQNAIG